MAPAECLNALTKYFECFYREFLYASAVFWMLLQSVLGASTIRLLYLIIINDNYYFAC